MKILNFPYKTYYLLYSTVVACLMILGCERDDICSASTQTTARLSIQFNDINNQDDTKVVNGLAIRAIGNENFVEFNRDISEVFLPLEVTEEGILNVQRIEVIKDVELDADDDEDTQSNTDIIEISYTPEFVYVSRACGYKAVYNNLQISLINDEDNWIFSSQINNATIEDESEAHIILYH